MNIADYIIAGILLVSSVHGWYIGFILSFFNIAGYFIAGYIAKVYYQIAAVWLAQNSQIDEKIQSFISEKMMGQVVGTASESVPEANELLSTLPIEMKEKLLDNWPTTLKNPLTASVENMAQQASDLILNLLGMVLVFVVVLLVIKLLVAILNIMAKMPGLKEINRGGGLILGLLKGAIVVLIILAVMAPFIGTNPTHSFSVYVTESQFGSWLYNHNVLVWLIKDYLLTGLQVN